MWYTVSIICDVGMVPPSKCDGERERMNIFWDEFWDEIFIIAIHREMEDGDGALKVCGTNSCKKCNASAFVT
jgi:hypothetical protein